MPIDDNIYYRQVALLLGVLPYVSRETCFALKGGTAINLFIRDMPRLSVDIDLTYLPLEGRDESQRNISRALGRIADSIETALSGISVQQVGAADQVLKLLVQRDRLRIKIEVSPVLRGSVRVASLRGVSPSVEQTFGYTEAQILHAHDIYAGKICAALDRQHPRDLFDMKIFFETDEINDELLDVFIVYLISGDRPIAELLSPGLVPLETTFETQFRGMTLQQVTLRELEETRKKLVQLINDRLTDAHREFLVQFKEGEPDWSLLSIEGIENLPGVQWKLLNIRRMATKKHRVSVDRLKMVLYG